MVNYIGAMQSASPLFCGFTAAKRLSVAPMLDWTDRYYRRFVRLLTKRTKLYTEMVVTQSLIHGNITRLLDFDPEEHPLALQLGGGDPEQLAHCSRIAQEWGYQEVNLNVGCPSDRVQSGRMGACLMAEPDLVARCVEAMTERCSLPVTVKTRIGIDHQDDYLFLENLALSVMDAGCDHLIIHARKAWLDGLSPRENRTIPPLNYGRVQEIKQAHPDWLIVLNGGVLNLQDAETVLEWADGVMIGRAAYERPWILRGADEKIFGDSSNEAILPATQADAVRAYIPFVEERLKKGDRLHWMTRHLLGLFHGEPGARGYRRVLVEGAAKPGAGPEAIEKALASIG